MIYLIINDLEYYIDCLNIGKIFFWGKNIGNVALERNGLSKVIINFFFYNKYKVRYEDL